MFDVGFQEIVLIGIIALLVIGPERLPSVARSVGLWAGKMQRFVAGVKSDIRNELQNEELRGLLNNQEDQIRELQRTLTETRNEFTKTASVASGSLSDGLSSAANQVKDAAKAVTEQGSVKDAGAVAPADSSVADSSVVDSSDTSKGADADAVSNTSTAATSTDSSSEKPGMINEHWSKLPMYDKPAPDSQAEVSPELPSSEKPDSEAGKP